MLLLDGARDTTEAGARVHCPVRAGENTSGRALRQRTADGVNVKGACKPDCVYEKLSLNGDGLVRDCANPHAWEDFDAKPAVLGAREIRVNGRGGTIQDRHRGNEDLNMLRCKK